MGFENGQVTCQKNFPTSWGRGERQRGGRDRLVMGGDEGGGNRLVMGDERGDRLVMGDERGG